MLEDRATYNKNLLPGSDGKPDILTHYFCL